MTSRITHSRLHPARSTSLFSRSRKPSSPTGTCPRCSMTWPAGSIRSCASIIWPSCCTTPRATLSARTSWRPKNAPEPAPSAFSPGRRSGGVGPGDPAIPDRLEPGRGNTLAAFRGTSEAVSREQLLRLATDHGAAPPGSAGLRVQAGSGLRHRGRRVPAARRQPGGRGGRERLGYGQIAALKDKLARRRSTLKRRSAPDITSRRSSARAPRCAGS